MLGRNGKGIVPNTSNSSSDNLAAQETNRRANLNHYNSQNNINHGSGNDGYKDFNPHSGTIILQGTLSKKGRGTLYHPWSARFITVDDCGILRYYKQPPSSSNKFVPNSSPSSEDKTNLRGVIDIKGCKIRALTPAEVKTHRPFSFILEQLPYQYATQSPTLTLAAASSTEMHGWISLLKTLVTTLAEQELERSKIQYETLNGLIGKGNAPNATIAEFRLLKEMRREQQRQRDALLDGNRDEDDTTESGTFGSHMQDSESDHGDIHSHNHSQHALMIEEQVEIGHKGQPT